MDRLPVKSSNIRSVGYDPALRVLHVELPGGVYEYADVPPEVHQDMMAAPSVGGYFAAKISGAFAGKKLEEEKKDGD